VDLAHILLKIKPSPDADARAKSLIDSLYQAISQGADFARTAELFSQDPGSAKRGGALGWAKRGDFVPEFESVAFNLEAGKFSEPIKSRFGYHLILLNDRQGEKINLSHILVKLTPSNDDRQRTLSLADSLFTLLLNGADFAQLAQQYSDDEESRAEGGHIGTFAVKDLIPLYAKAIEGLPPGTFTQPLKSDLGMQIVKVIDRTKERPLTLENDWEAIAQITLNQKKEKVYRQWVDELIKDVYVDIKGVK
jgi:peptidyl-prolyl cis-trans isomerase SurA